MIVPLFLAERILGVGHDFHSDNSLLRLSREGAVTTDKAV